MRRSLVGAVQVAGVHDMEEAEGLVAAGVEFIGVPLRLPDGREDLDEDAAVDLFARIGDRADRVLITYQQDAREIAIFADRLGCDWVQLHGRMPVAAIAELRAQRPALGLIQALVIGADDVMVRLAETEAHVDAFITDTFDPATGRRGATGLVHDWPTSRAIVQATRRPVILAGGLDAENVGDAIAAARPAAVDVHTRVEGADGRKDGALVEAFVDRARAAFAAIAGEGVGHDGGAIGAEADRRGP